MSERPDNKYLRVIIKKEFYQLTKNTNSAIILSQLEYWQRRVYEFDGFLAEERRRCESEGIPHAAEPTNGWIYKTATDLAEECLLDCSHQTAGRLLNDLVDKGWVLKRNNPRFKWDRTYQYRLDLKKIQEDLKKIGYDLRDWGLNSPENPGNSALSKMDNPLSKMELGLSTMDKQYQRLHTEIKQKEKYKKEKVITPQPPQGGASLVWPKGPKSKKPKPHKNEPSAEAVEVLLYLNEKTQRHYEPIKSTCILIEARLKDGHTVKQMKAVIDSKWAEWGSNPEMHKCVNYKTLFRPSNFPGYLAEIDAKPAQAESNTAPKTNVQPQCKKMSAEDKQRYFFESSEAQRASMFEKAKSISSILEHMSKGQDVTADSFTNHPSCSMMLDILEDSHYFERQKEIQRVKPNGYGLDMSFFSVGA